MVRTVSGQPGRIPGPEDPASPAGPGGHRGPGIRDLPSTRQRATAFIRRHHLTPYALLLPSVVAIGLLLFWPTIQIAEFSLQNYGLPQVTGNAPTQWVGGANFSAILSDPEFWLSLRISLIFAAVVVPLTLLTGTLVGLLLNRLGPKMAAFVSSAAMLAWATPAVSASVIFIWLTDPDGGVVASPTGPWPRCRPGWAAARTGPASAGRTRRCPPTPC
jgi:N,N'-diacetylchitobiose transport system permease protein